MSGARERLIERIREGGPLPFAEFMEEALYGDGGYYAGERHPVGRGGDYITGSSHSPLFGRATASMLRALDRPLGGVAELVEIGCGSGEHLRAVAAALGEGDAAAGPRRRIRAWDRVMREIRPVAEPLSGLQALGPRSVRGMVFSYELFDALPVHRVVGGASGPEELLVDLDPRDERYVWRRAMLSDAALGELLGALGVELEVDQIADLSLDWEPLYRRLAESLARGLLVTADYGYDGGRLYDPRVRRHGTLACYREHRVHRDPFAHVGEQDLTAHVDFDLLRSVGEQTGLTTVAFTRQALWLTAAGLFDELAEADLETRIAAQTLLAPDGMGSDLRVLVQARDLDLSSLPAIGLLV